ncbi:hypothetical protein H8Z72_19595 [Xanthomonas citri pv. citri]|uniref:Uncharacterized protein n=5 Tax=Xanthomonas TaxID=338 RepID=A0A2N3RPZ2_9XANT|nr:MULTISPECIES: hypothetical protein [Xanthomonas]OOW58105.1 hypothetical protein Xcnt_20970 [Xanthomonas campestris pv. centellae]AJZ46587.1 hypothetical protein J165_04505 [Xanthomonas citri pv. citri]AJZ51207.1 hypothetical protein J166_04510 [Xanthomonas citri pv. citri]AJZ55828.1 hypothetical protein J167_04511 [Xanthomonas citri pv. citri]AJZ68618.1 hypothetical protein J168_04506 [Xanthomonas citri pv. citri]
MTQRQVDHDSPLPPCTNGHLARHMLDARRPEAGGGHFIECVCGRTQKHPSFELAMTEWRRAHRIRTPREPRPRAHNVVQLGLRFTGTHQR